MVKVPLTVLVPLEDKDYMKNKGIKAGAFLTWCLRLSRSGDLDTKKKNLEIVEALCKENDALKDLLDKITKQRDALQNALLEQKPA